MGRADRDDPAGAPMRVTVRFVDGEELEGEAQRVSLARGGFTIVGTGGNTRSIWVATGAIKYVTLHPTRPESPGDFDPRAALNLPKVVLHFLDGQVLHSYEDEVFASRPGGFTVRLWDPRHGQLVQALVSGASLKGVFTVDEWDSRSEADRTAHAFRDRVSAPGLTRTWVEQDTLLDVGPGVSVEQAVEEPIAVAEEAVVEVEEPILLQDLPGAEPAALAEENLTVALIRGDAEERRASFYSGLMRRRKLAQTETPEQERHRQLRARISEVLGSIEPARDGEDDDGAG
jgi:hypothetical protein